MHPRTPVTIINFIIGFTTRRIKALTVLLEPGTENAEMTRAIHKLELVENLLVTVT